MLEWGIIRPSRSNWSFHIGSLHPYVPARFRKVVFDALHNLSHPGIGATQQHGLCGLVLTEMYVSGPKPVISVSNSKFIGTLSHKSAHSPHLMQGFIMYTCIYIVGPLPPSNGKTYSTCIYWLALIDSHAGLSQYQSLTSFITHWIAQFGTPSSVTTDRGRQFANMLANMLGCKRIQTPSYHPASNGLVERFQRQFKASLKAHSTLMDSSLGFAWHSNSNQIRSWLLSCRDGFRHYGQITRWVFCTWWSSAWSRSQWVCTTFTSLFDTKQYNSRYNHHMMAHFVSPSALPSF